MSICCRRLIIWLVLTAASIALGIVVDLLLKTQSFPIFIRFLGLVGIILTHFPLKRTGKLLRISGDPEKWGCTTRLVTTDLYRCVRHPHHVSVGLFMTSLGLLIGHLWSFLIIAISQWVWVIGFLFLVEEKELEEKFGLAYKAYRQQVPMLFPNPLCVLRVFSKPIEKPKN